MTRGSRGRWFAALLAAAFGVGCQRESWADDTAPSVPARAAPSTLSTPASPPHPEPEWRRPTLPFEPSDSPRRVGFLVSLSGTRFLIWGAAAAGFMPKGLATTPDGTRLFASNMGLAGQRILSVYAADPLTPLGELDLPGRAIELAVSPDSTELYVTNDRAWGTLMVFGTREPARGSELVLRRELSLPGFPKWMTLAPDGRRLFAALWALDGISEVELATGTVRTLRTTKGRHSRHPKRDKNPRGLAFSKDGRTLVVANNADETLSLIDVETFSERERVHVGYAPRHVVSAPSGRLYVSLTGHDAVLEFDVEARRAVREIPVGKRPKTIAVSHDGRFLYAANFVSNSLSIVDLDSLSSVELELALHKPSGLSVRADDRFVYVSGFCTHDVWAIERLDGERAPTLPLGPDRINEPCLDCPSSFEGCPWFPGPNAIVEHPTTRPASSPR